MKNTLRNTIAMLAAAIAAAVPCLGQDKPDEAKALLEATLARYELFFLQNFTVKVKSPEISQALSAQISAATQKMGVPIQVAVDHFIFDYQDGKTAIKATLANVPAQVKDRMEAEANKLIANTPVGKTLQTITFDSIKKGIDFLRENQENVTVKKDADAYTDFFVNGYNQSFGGNMKLKGVMFRLDKQKQVIVGIKFAFDNNRSMLVKMAYENTKVPESGLFVPALTQSVIAQSGITAGPGVQVPQKATIYYWDYEFHKDRGGQGGNDGGDGGANPGDPW